MKIASVVALLTIVLSNVTFATQPDWTHKLTDVKFHAMGMNAQHAWAYNNALAIIFDRFTGEVLDTIEYPPMTVRFFNEDLERNRIDVMGILHTARSNGSTVVQLKFTKGNPVPDTIEPWIDHFPSTVPLHGNFYGYSSEDGAFQVYVQETLTPPYNPWEQPSISHKFVLHDVAGDTGRIAGWADHNYMQFHPSEKSLRYDARNVHNYINNKHTRLPGGTGRATSDLKYHIRSIAPLSLRGIAPIFGEDSTNFVVPLKKDSPYEVNKIKNPNFFRSCHIVYSQNSEYENKNSPAMFVDISRDDTLAIFEGVGPTRAICPVRDSQYLVLDTSGVLWSWNIPHLNREPLTRIHMNYDTIRVKQFDNVSIPAFVFPHVDGETVTRRWGNGSTSSTESWSYDKPGTYNFEIVFEWGDTNQLVGKKTIIVEPLEHTFGARWVNFVSDEGFLNLDVNTTTREVLVGGRSGELKLMEIDSGFALYSSRIPNDARACILSPSLGILSVGSTTSRWSNNHSGGGSTEGHLYHHPVDSAVPQVIRGVSYSSWSHSRGTYTETFFGEMCFSEFSKFNTYMSNSGGQSGQQMHQLFLSDTGVVFQRLGNPHSTSMKYSTTASLSLDSSRFTVLLTSNRDPNYSTYYQYYLVGIDGETSEQLYKHEVLDWEPSITFGHKPHSAIDLEDGTALASNIWIDKSTGEELGRIPFEEHFYYFEPNRVITKHDNRVVVYDLKQQTVVDSTPTFNFPTRYHHYERTINAHFIEVYDSTSSRWYIARFDSLTRQPTNPVVDTSKVDTSTIDTMATRRPNTSWPLPCFDEVNVAIDTTVGTLESVTITDIVGNSLVLPSSNVNVQPNSSLKIQLSTPQGPVTAGTYILMVRYSHGLRAYPIVVQR